MRNQEIHGLGHGRSFWANDGGIDLRESGFRNGTGEFGINRTEADGGDDDTGGREFLGGDLGERFDCGLARDISGFTFELQRDGDGGEVDDTTGALTDHDLADGLEAVERAQVIHAHELLGDGTWRKEQGVQGGRPRIIDQQVDAAGGGHGRDGGTHGGFVGDIDDMRGETGVRQVLRSTRETMHGPTFREEAFGQGTAKALRGTGDEGGGHF